MTPKGIRNIVRLALIGLFLLGAGLSIFGTRRAEAKTGVNQQATDYPYPVQTLQDNFSYPVETDQSGDQEPGLTNTPGLIGTPTLTHTPGPSPTPVIDVFGTEDAQVGDSLVTQPVSPTPGASITPVNTSTPVFTPTGTVVSGMLDDSNRDQGFQVDWGFFMIGFVIPILVGSGLVLYLLDRRPDLFSQRH